jgi:hypothetical protein
MSDPNSALSAWQLAVMAVVPLMALAAWLTAVFLAARQPRPDRAAVALPGESPAQTAGITAASATKPRPEEHEPARQAADRKAA